MRNILHSSLTALSLGLLAFASQNAQAKTDPLASYKLNLGDPDVCKIYYMRAGEYQTLEDQVVGVCQDGTDSIKPGYPSIAYLYDGKFPDSRTVLEQSGLTDPDEIANFVKTVSNFEGEIGRVTNQGFFVFDFGEKGVDLHKLAIYNSGYFQRFQQTTVFACVAGPVSDGPCTDDAAALKWQKGAYETAATKIFRTNGDANQQAFKDFVTVDNHWVTGSVNPSVNEPGYWTSTTKVGGHLKYRYIAIYDWSNPMGLSEVEMWGTLLKNTTKTDVQIDLERAIAEAESRADEFAMSDEAAVAALNAKIAEAKQALTADDAAVAEAMTALATATDEFMASITYVVGDDEYFCAINTASGELGLKLEKDATTIGNYTGYKLVSCDPADALSFSIRKGAVVNGQQAYQLSTAEGTVIQSGETLLLVDNSLTNATNVANFIFTQRYTDGENSLYDLKAGPYYYYIDDQTNLAATKEFPAYEDFTEILAYVFTLAPSSFEKNPEEIAVLFKGWEFNEASKAVTEVFGDELGKNAGYLTEGWRQSKYRNYTRAQQHTVNGNGYLVVSINNPYFAPEDVTASNPLVPYVDKNSVLTGDNNTPALVREHGVYADQIAREPVDGVRDDTYNIIINPLYTPYLAVKMAGSNAEEVSLNSFSLTLFISKGNEPTLRMSNCAGRKGDVYYWNLFDCGLAAGQIAYCAQYMGFGAVKTTQEAYVIDWVRPFETVNAVPEETIEVKDLALIIGELPESPEYARPEVDAAQLRMEKYLTVVNANGEDVTTDYAAQVATAIDGDKTVSAALPADTYYLITLPKAIRCFNTLSVYVPNASVNEYSNNVLFFKEKELDLTKDAYGSYVPNGGALWQHNAFSGEVEKEDLCVTFTNTKEEEFYYIAIKGDNGGNPMTLSEIELTYDKQLKFQQFEPIDENINYWNLTTNWASTRTNGKVELTEDGYLAVTSGTDNAKRGDIKDTKSIYYLQNHTVVFYTCEVTNVETIQAYGDMKFGYNAVVPAFDPELGVQNEQMMRKNSDQQYILEDGSQLVYFDLATTNANKAFFEGNSGEAFDGTKKDQYRNLLVADQETEIYNPTFTLIAKDASNFVIKSMGTAKDVETLIDIVVNGGTGINELNEVAKAPRGIYDVQGRRLRSISAPGLYIVNGKTVIVK